MSNYKKILSVLLALILALSTLIVTPVGVSAAVSDSFTPEKDKLYFDTAGTGWDMGTKDKVAFHIFGGDFGTEENPTVPRDWGNKKLIGTAVAGETGVFEFDPAAKEDLSFTPGVQYKISFIHVNGSNWMEYTYDLYFTTDCFGHVAYCDGTYTEIPYPNGTVSCLTAYWTGIDPTVNGPVPPTEPPTEAPTEALTEAPTEAPTMAPTVAPTIAPTMAPTEPPTEPVVSNPDDYDYTIDDGKAIINYYFGSAERISIPDTLGGCPVTAIGENAFTWAYVTEVTIPETVTKIGNKAFEECASLSKVTIPDSVTELGNRAFSGCTSLTEINIPDSVTEIGTSAFSGCTSLTEITIPDSVTELGKSAFMNCTALTEVAIPGSVTKIGESAFMNCTALTEIAIPGSVTKIESNTFSGCTLLSKVTLSEGLQTIDTFAFDYCASLSDITIPDTVTEIASAAFAECTSLTEITIPTSMTRINQDTFNGCTGLESVTLPETLLQIGTYAFSNCSSLTEITIPSGTKIGEYAFENCAEALTIYGYTNSYAEEYADNKGIAFVSIGYADNPYFSYTITNGKATVTRYSGKKAALVIPATLGGCPVTAIGSAAFGDCTTLTQINIPATVTEIGSYAFYGCSALAQIDLPDSVAAISDYAFMNCTSLTEITISGSIDQINQKMFRGCSALAKITLPERTRIGYDTFKDCSGDLTIYGYTDSYAEDFALQYGFSFVSVGVAKDLSHYFSFTLKDGEATVTGYNGRATEITVPETLGDCPVTTIGSDAFKDCRLVSLTLTDAVKKINNNAFRGCTGPKTLTVLSEDVQISDLAGDVVRGFVGSTTEEYCRKHKKIFAPVDIEYNPDYIYSIYDSEASIYRYLGDEEDLTIPSELNGYPVTAIYGLADPSLITSGNIRPYRLVIPESVKLIGRRALLGPEFTDVTFLSKIMTIDYFDDGISESPLFGWYDVNESRYVWNSDSIQVRGYAGSTIEAYCRERQLTFIPIGLGTEDNPDYDYTVCNGKACITRYKGSEENVIVPRELDGYPVVEIGYQNREEDSGMFEIRPHGAFENTTVRSVTLPDTVQKIDKRAFYGCETLTAVNMPSALKKVGEYAFYGCTSFNGIRLPDGLTTIEDYAFAGCSSLTELTIPASAVELGYISDEAGCNEYLDDIIIDEDGKPVGCYPNGFHVFTGCTGLESITVDAYNPLFDSRDNCNAIVQKYTNNLLFGCQNTVIPDTVTVIGKSAFENCTGLTELVIPDNVLTIHRDAFNRCTGLQQIVIPAQIGYDDLCAGMLGTISVYMTNGKNEWYELQKDPDSNLVIYGYYGTDAERYAAEYDIPFRMIGSAVDDEVIVDAPEGCTYSVVKKATADEASPDESALIHNQPLPEGSILLDVYDIILRSAEDETPIQPTSPVTVRIRCDHPDAHVFRREADGSLTDMHAVYEDGWLIFDVDHFSLYIVATGAEIDIALCGDADGDGRVTSLDVANIQRYIAALETGIPNEILLRGDVDGNGKLEIIDATCIQRYLAKIDTPYAIGKAL